MTQIPKRPREWVAAWKWDREHGVINRSSNGGHVADYPAATKGPWQFDPATGKPHPRSPEKRRALYLTIGNFPGFPHCHVQLEERDNRFLDPGDPTAQWEFDRKPTWRRCWDQQEGLGRRLSTKFDTRAEADEAIRQFIAKHFSRKTHRFVPGHHDRRYWSKEEKS